MVERGEERLVGDHSLVEPRQVVQTTLVVQGEVHEVPVDRHVHRALDGADVVGRGLDVFRPTVEVVVSSSKM